MGERAYNVVRDPKSSHDVRVHRPDFRTITYRELRDRVERVANAWRRVDGGRVEPGKLVCTVGSAGVDHVVVDLACLYV